MITEKQGNHEKRPCERTLFPISTDAGGADKCVFNKQLMPFLYTAPAPHYVATFLSVGV